MVIALDYESEIHYAMAFNFDVKITTKKANMILKVHYIDNLNGQIRAIDENGGIYYINLDHIMDVEVQE